MGKHNGKARKTTGERVGAALARRKHTSAPGGGREDKHTTESNNMQSVLDRNDLDELMAIVRAGRGAARDQIIPRHQVIEGARP